MSRHLEVLSTGRVVAKGCIPSTRAQLSASFNPFHNKHKLKSLPPPPANCYNSAGVKWDMDGNGPPTSYDMSYQGPPVGDCVPTMQSNLMTLLSVCTNGKRVGILAKDVVAWYFAHTGGRDTGMNIGEALNMMMTDPVPASDGSRQVLGPNGIIDYTNKTIVMLAIQLFKGLSIGVDAGPLQNVVGDHDGWFLTGAPPTQNLDHCVGIIDYGSLDFLAQSYNVNIPNGIDKNSFGLGLGTWATKGIIDWQSFVNITGEAHVVITSPQRGDSVTWDAIAQGDFIDIVNPPQPGPTPTPTPIPTPTPVPPSFGPTLAQVLMQCHNTLQSVAHHYPFCSHALNVTQTALVKDLTPLWGGVPPPNRRTDMDPGLKAQCKSCGMTDDQIAKLSAVAPTGFNWMQLLALISKYGPGIITDILALFPTP